MDVCRCVRRSITDASTAEGFLGWAGLVVEAVEGGGGCAVVGGLPARRGVGGSTPSFLAYAKNTPKSPRNWRKEGVDSLPCVTREVLEGVGMQVCEAIDNGREHS